MLLRLSDLPTPVPTRQVMTLIPRQAFTSSGTD